MFFFKGNFPLGTSWLLKDKISTTAVQTLILLSSSNSALKYTQHSSTLYKSQSLEFHNLTNLNLHNLNFPKIVFQGHIDSTITDLPFQLQANAHKVLYFKCYKIGRQGCCIKNSLSWKIENVLQWKLVEKIGFASFFFIFSSFSPRPLFSLFFYVMEEVLTS